MKPSLFAALTGAIESWISNNCEEDHWPDCYVHPDMAEDMARAAAAVVDSAEKSQRFALLQA